MKKILFHYPLVYIALCTIIISLLTLFNQSLRLDEAQSLWVATKPPQVILAADALDVLVPLYTILLHFWIQIFGVSTTASRSLSLVFYLLTLPMLYLLYKGSSTRKTALLGVLAFSLSPFIVWYSNESRMYSLFTFVATCSSYYYLRFINSSGKEGKMGYLLSTLAGIYTHYFFIFLIITQVIFLLVRTVLWDIKKRDFSHVAFRAFWEYKKMLITFFSLLGLAIIAFIPWATYVISLGSAANSQPLLTRPTTFNIFQTFVNFLFGFQTLPVQSVLVSFWPLIVMAFFFVFTRKRDVATRDIDYFVVVSLLPIMLLFLLSFIKPIFLPRYLIFTTPSLFFVVVWLLVQYSKKVSTVLLSGFLTLLFCLLLYQNLSTATPVKENYEGVAYYLNTHVTPYDVVAVTAPFTIYPVEYYYKGSSLLTTIPVWDRYTIGPVPSFSYAKLGAQLNGYTNVYTNLYVVYSYDQGYESKIKDFLEVHYQTIKKIKFSSGLELRIYTLRMMRNR